MSEWNGVLTEELLKDLKEYLQRHPAEYDLSDYEVPDKLIKKLWYADTKPDDMEWSFYEELMDPDWEYDMECEYVRDWVEDHYREILMLSEGLSPDRNVRYTKSHRKITEWAALIQEAHRDDYLEYFSCNMNLDNLLEEPVPFVFALYTNNDCAASGWLLMKELEEGAESDYLNDVCEVFGLDKSAVYDEIRRVSDRNGEEIPGEPVLSKESVTDGRAIAREIWNSTSPGVFTICANVPLKYLNAKRFVLRKGSPYGFYGCWEGGGSFFNAELKADFEADLTIAKTNRYSVESYWGGNPVCCTHGYSIKECFGDTDWFGEASVVEESETEKKQEVASA
jgi:hypothetical protein